jgi:hypothetical protein
MLVLRLLKGKLGGTFFGGGHGVNVAQGDCWRKARGLNRRLTGLRD